MEIEVVDNPARQHGNLIYDKAFSRLHPRKCRMARERHRLLLEEGQIILEPLPRLPFADNLVNIKHPAQSESASLAQVIWHSRRASGRITGLGLFEGVGDGPSESHSPRYAAFPEKI